MSDFQRTASVTSTMSTCSSIDTTETDNGTSDKPNRALDEIPFARRRLMHEQTAALLASFERQTHPSKDERVNLAEQLGMELKTVSAWFQNRRRSVKRKSLAWTRACAENHYAGSAYPAVGKRQVVRNESIISLNCIVSARERPQARKPSAAVLVVSPTRPPLTPRRLNARRVLTTPTKRVTNLWDHIPSSPTEAPSSPASESLRLAALPRRSKTLRSLEWACAIARARQGYKQAKVKTVEEDMDLPELIPDGGTSQGDLSAENDTEAEDFEAITPDVSALQLVVPQLSPKSKGKEIKDRNAPSQDMEAAMALLGFMGRNELHYK